MQATRIQTARKFKPVIAIFALLTVAACGGDEWDDQQPTGPTTPAWQNRTPKLLMASPGSMSVGQKLVILGQHFISPQYGYPMLVIKGTYYDSNGNAQPVDLQKKAKYVNSGKLTWTLWPNIVFDRTGDHLGSFIGSVIVVNVGNDQSQKYSSRLPTKIVIKPSIIIRSARPTNSNCTSVVSKSIENTGFSFTADVVGLRKGTKDNPLTFYWTFLADQWQVAWNYGSMDPNSVFPKSGGIVIEDTVTSGTTSVVQDGGSKNLLVKVGNDILGTAKLKVLKTAKVPTKGQSYTATVALVAVDSSNKQARLAIPLHIARKAAMHYDGKVRIVERYQPRAVSDCIPGGDIGRQVTYSEDKGETRARSMSFNYNASLAINVSPIPSNPFALGINFSLGFGVDTSASMSSSKSIGKSLSGQILPGEYGMFYRQTTKVERVGVITIRNACGAEASPGTAHLTDWIWAADLAAGPTCPPKTMLPPAQKFY